MSAHRSPTPPRPHRPARRGDASLDRWIRWTPLVIGAVFVLGVLSLFFVSTPRGPSGPPGRGAGWVDLARGEVCFLAEREEFAIEQDWTATGRFRVRSGERAFEDSDCERVLRTFVRDALVGVRSGEAWRLRIRRRGVVATAASRVRGELDWPLALREEKQGGASWWTALFAPGACEDITAGDAPGDAAGEVFAAARSSEDVKEKISRTIAGELVRELTSS